MEPNTVYLILTLMVAGNDPDIVQRLKMPSIKECMSQVEDRLSVREPKEVMHTTPTGEKKVYEVTGIMAGCARPRGYSDNALNDTGTKLAKSRARYG